jgi:hypothetical protein
MDSYSNNSSTDFKSLCNCDERLIKRKSGARKEIKHFIQSHPFKTRGPKKAFDNPGGRYGNHS